MKTITIFILTFVLTAKAALPEMADQKQVLFHGLSDASAAIAIATDTFIVADDETNTLRVYKTDNTKKPVQTFDLSGFLEINPEHPEADIEAATVVQNRIYWITSHGRNKDGKLRPNRYRFFATEFKIDNGKISIQTVGKPYTNLMQDMVDNYLLKSFGLEEATRFREKKLKKKELKKLAPKEQGVNIEGLSASADGKTIFIAFRNPRPKDPATGRSMAIIVPLINPETVIEKSAAPEFSYPILWDLKGMGIRSMEYSQYHKSYFIIAGPHDTKSSFILYRWSGKTKEHPIAVGTIEVDNFTPEALMPVKNSNTIILLSDDGSKIVPVTDRSQCLPGELIDNDKCQNKHLVDPDKKTFGAMFLSL